MVDSFVIQDLGLLIDSAMNQRSSSVRSQRRAPARVWL